MLLLLAVVFALNATHQTASRLTWSFARDNALFGSRWLGKMDDKQQVPIAALVFNFAIMFIIGCIYLGSTSAFNAFIGTGLILQHVTYAFPAVLLMMRKRSAKWLPSSRSFKLPSVVGWAANLTTVGFAILVFIFYDFPTVIPVTGTSMSKLHIRWFMDVINLFKTMRRRSLVLWLSLRLRIGSGMRVSTSTDRDFTFCGSRAVSTHVVSLVV